MTEKEIKELLEERDSLLKKLSGKEHLLGKKEQLLGKKEQRILELENENILLRKKLYGATSERFISSKPDDRQLDLFGDELTEEEREILENEAQKNEAVITKTIKVKKPRTVRSHKSWENLRVEYTFLDPIEKDDERYTHIGEDISDKIAFKPAEIYIKRTVRNKYALKKEVAESPEGEILKQIVMAPLPENSLNKSLADPSIVSEIILQKYLYHMPFYRQIQHFKNMGVVLSSSTIGDWFASASELLKPIYDQLRKNILATDYLQVDESTMQVIDDDKGKTKKGYIWVVRDPIKGDVFFHYDNGSRSYNTAAVLLKDFNGAIQSDGYQAYNQFEKINGKLTLGCWAHARRKFEESIPENKELATQAMLQIQKLYDIEREADEENLSYDDRKKLRHKKSYPILCTFEKWLLDASKEVVALKSSRLGKAITYTYSIFPKLSRYHLDGRYRIDNNLVENAIRPLAIGRKNYLFCGNHEAAIRAAIIYSLVGSCKAREVNPHEWLSYAMENINSSKNIADLLPENFKKSQENIL